MGLMEGLADGCEKSIGAFGGARDEVDSRALPNHHLIGQVDDPGTRIARQAFGNVRGNNLSVLDNHRSLNVTMHGRTPAGIGPVLVFAGWSRHGRHRFRLLIIGWPDGHWRKA